MNSRAPGAIPVEGLEKTLKVEISAGDKKKVFDLRPAFRDPGHFNERVSWAALDIPNPGQMPDFQNHMGGIAAGLLGIVIAIAAIILNRKKRQ